jgi:anti-sigma factor RsiW
MHLEMSRFSRDEERLSAYLDGELDAAEAAKLEARLAEDPALAAELDAVHDVVLALRGLDTVEPPPGFADRLQARLEHETGAEQRVVALPRRRPWVAIASAAAVVAFVGLVGGIVLQRGSELLGPAEAVRTPATAARGLETGANGRGPVTLDDAGDVRAYFSRMPQVAELPGTLVAQSPAARLDGELIACAEQVAPGGRPVVAHAAPVRYQGRDALAYLVLHERGGVLERPEAVVVEAGSCAVTQVVGL